MAFDLEVIKGSHSLAEYIGKYVRLKKQGSEWTGLSPFTTEKTPSFFVNEAKGFYHCFSSGEHGDLIDFACKFHKVRFTDACEILGGQRLPPETKLTPRSKSAPEPDIVPADVPDSHEPFVRRQPLMAINPRDDHPRLKQFRPDYIWPYHTPAGELLGYVMRLDMAEGKKIIMGLRPAMIDGAVQWVTVHLDRPRPLYNIAKLQPGPVYICEGEKPADALTRIFGAPALSWYGGTHGVPHTDFSPLKDRDVVIWGDADEPGEIAAHVAAQRAHEAGANSVKVIPWDHDKDKGWDAADAEEEIMTKRMVMAWINERVVDFIPDEVMVSSEPAAADHHEEDGVDTVDTIPPTFDAMPYSGSLPPPRPWAFGRILLQRAVTAIAAPPGVGKSTWAMQLAVAFSQNMPFGDMQPVRTGPVWLWNNEDDGDELDRVALAACLAMGVDQANLFGKLYLNSGSDKQLIVAEETRDGGFVAHPDVDRVIQIIKDRGIKLLIVDPFAETYSVQSENNNDVMKKVAALYRYIAQVCDCCVLIIVHTPKGANADKSAGSLDTIRGGGAVGGVVRIALTMFEMSELDAEKYGVAPERRKFYVRLDNAKGNRSEPTSEAMWWMREGIGIDNAADGYPSDMVGTLRPWTFATPEAKQAKSDAQFVDRVASEIVRICELNGYTTPEKATPLNTIMSALDVVKTGVKSTKARDIILGQFGPLHGHEDHLIILSEIGNTGYIRRMIHVERKRR